MECLRRCGLSYACQGRSWSKRPSPSAHPLLDRILFRCPGAGGRPPAPGHLNKIRPLSPLASLVSAAPLAHAGSCLSPLLGGSLEAVSWSVSLGPATALLAAWKVVLPSAGPAPLHLCGRSLRTPCPLHRRWPDRHHARARQRCCSPLLLTPHHPDTTPPGLGMPHSLAATGAANDPGNNRSTPNVAPLAPT
jgi:hypothetical protein